MKRLSMLALIVVLLASVPATAALTAPGDRDQSVEREALSRAAREKPKERI